MALLGQGALAMWWNMAPEFMQDFEDWHTHEHFPERLSIPGFLRSSRWTSADGGEGIFVLYELQNYAVLSSAAYLARLNAPTPWSTKLMPHHRDMVRSQSHVLASQGFAIAGNVMTIRLLPIAGQAESLQASLAALIEKLASTTGFAGGHLLRHETPDIQQTAEQKIRGAADRIADWVLVICAYDLSALEALSHGELSDESLNRLGADAHASRGIYKLSCSATPIETR